MHMKEIHEKMLAYIFFYKCDDSPKNFYILFVKKPESFYKIITKNIFLQKRYNIKIIRFCW